ncbi:MAG: BTAD domain-containing putative transcriptional regulator, partial [Gemmatimonadota bacterium]
MNSHGVIRVRLLGTPAIEGAGVDGRAVLRQPKRLALLAYLAARDDYVTRDTLVGVFWPGSDEDRARRALSQAIHFLRGELGRRSIATRGAAEVAAGANIRCDVVEFDRAVREKSWEAALALYGGEFLEGVVSPRGNDLNQWIETERLRLQRLAVAAAAALSDAAYQHEDLAAAVSWQARALEVNPFDETAHRMYLALLDEAGDGAGALAAYEAFRTRLRSQYDLEPSSETRRIVELIRTRRPDVARAAEAATAVPEPKPAPVAVAKPARAPVAMTAVPVPAGPRWLPAWLRSRPWLQVGVAAAALPILIWVAAKLGRDPDPPGPSSFIANRIAVLYFEVASGEQDLGYIANGITTALISYLQQAPSLEVVPANAVDPFRGEHVPPDSINALLHAATLISGRIAQDDDGRIRVTAQIEDAAKGVLYKSIVVETSADDLFGVIDSVTRQVREALSPDLAELVNAGRWRAGTANEVAFRTLMQGASAAETFDDRFRAQDTMLAQAAFVRADSLYREASRLDPAWSTPHVMRGQLAFHKAFMYELRYEIELANAWLNRAVAYADLAINLQPDASALELKGQALYEQFVLDSFGAYAVLDSADAALARSVLLEPDRAGAWATRSAIMFTRGDFEMAEETARKALSLDAFLENRNEIQNRVFLSAFHAFLDNRAKATCQEIYETQQGHWTAAQCVLNLMAWSNVEKPDPKKAWRELEANLLRDPPMLAEYQRPQLEMMLAAVLAKAGLPDSAEHVIARAAEAGGGDPELLYYEAAARIALGQTDSAGALLRTYLDGDPPSRMHVADYRWFLTPKTPL